MTLDKGRLINTMLNMPYPMNYLPEYQKQIIALSIMAMEDQRKRRI